MTVSSSNRKAGPFLGNGVTTAFPFAFKVFKKEDVVSTFTNINGADSVLTLDSDYSVAFNSDQNNNPGGTITYPAVGSPLAILQTGEKLTLTGGLAYTQPTDLPNPGPYFAQVVEDALDRAEIQIQQIKEITDRSIKISVSDSPLNPLPSAPARANMLIGFDALGGVTVVPEPASIGAGDMCVDVFAAGVDYTAGVTTQLVLSRAPGNPANLEIFFDSFFQGTDQWAVNGQVVTFNSAIPVGITKVFARIGTTLSTEIPPIGSVGDGQIVWANILNRVVDSIGALRALDKSKYNRAFVTGYDAPGDGGGGAYWYDSSDATSADNGGTIIVAADGARWKLALTGTLTVKQFGAKGDGVTVDTAAVAAALAVVNVAGGGGRLRFPRGTYLLGASLNITQNGVVLVGDGCENTTLLFTSGGVTIIGTSLVNIDGSYVEGMKIKRSGAATGTGLDIQWAHEGKFMDVRVFGFSVGMNLSNAWVNHFYRCRWDGNDTGVNCLTNSNAVHFFGGSINNNNVSATSVGIVIRGCWNVGLHGVDIEYNSFRGVSIRGNLPGEIFTGGIIIDGCYIEENGTPGSNNGRHIEVGGYGTLPDANQVANVYIRNNIFFSNNDAAMDAALGVFNAYDVKFNDNQHPGGITYATKAVVLAAGAQSFYAANNGLDVSADYVLTVGATFNADLVQTGSFTIATDGSGNGVADFTLLLPYYFSLPWIDVAVTRSGDNSTMGAYGLTNFTGSGARFRITGGQASTTYTMFWKARGGNNF